MRKNIILNLKKDVSKLKPVCESLNRAFHAEELTIIGVCIHNISFETTKLNEMHDYLHAVRELANYDQNNQFIQYLWKELDMLFQGAQMMEEHEDEFQQEDFDENWINVF
jgi:hypothetical protein